MNPVGRHLVYRVLYVLGLLFLIFGAFGLGVLLGVWF